MKTTIASYLPELTALRRDLHQHPELGFEETRTAGIVAQMLGKYGIEVHTGWAKTGVVGVIKRGDSDRTIALRADMDALSLQEYSNLEYGSVNDGVMHACGHDGHMAMLLGAARYLAERGRFDGTVVFLFQPAEEGGGGGRLMVAEGVIDKFGIQAAYGLHIRSDLEAGHFATRPGTIMVATDNFEITVHGEGTHAALPHTGVDPIVTASQLVIALQSVVSRELKALDSAVLSITQFSSGSAYNVIPDEAVLRGGTRYRSPETGAALLEAMERVTAGVCSAYNARYTFQHMPGYPATINSPAETEAAVSAAGKALGADKVQGNCSLIMASEDFSYFLEKVPGCFAFLGNGTRTRAHRADFDFNDDILPLGIGYWVTLVEQELGERAE
ncbi:MAG: amidohydrolase [bacterium]|nr:MAG: amidohydrolase [bacterium]